MSAPFTFLEPGWWPLLLVIPAVTFWVAARDRAQSLRFAAAVGRPERVPSAPWRAAGSVVSGLVAWLAVVALMQPSWGEEAVPSDASGFGVIVALDVSRSMLARDLAPDRLERAKREVAALTAMPSISRFALVAFAGEARLATPLTRDRTSFIEILDALDPYVVARGGTNLAAAIDMSIDLAVTKEVEVGAILLVTDGEDLENRGLAAARRASERGLQIHVYGLGTPRGGKIPVPRDSGETWLLNEAGDEVVSRLDTRTLEAIAEATGGASFLAAEVALFDVVGELSESWSADGESKSTRPKNRFQWPLAAAILLGVMRLLPAWWRRDR